LCDIFYIYVYLYLDILLILAEPCQENIRERKECKFEYVFGLQKAFDETDKNTMGINEISRQFGKHPVLDFDNERRLVKHILKLGEAGFPPNRQAIRMFAQFAGKLNLKHNFDHDNEMAGGAWFKSFIERNPELCNRQAEGLY
ncbi:unnamed protein product, partial [Acanthoscelides obtectus]